MEADKAIYESYSYFICGYHGLWQLAAVCFLAIMEKRAAKGLLNVAIHCWHCPTYEWEQWMATPARIPCSQVLLKACSWLHWSSGTSPSMHHLFIYNFISQQVYCVKSLRLENDRSTFSCFFAKRYFLYLVECSQFKSLKTLSTTKFPYFLQEILIKRGVGKKAVLSLNFTLNRHNLIDWCLQELPTLWRRLPHRWVFTGRQIQPLRSTKEGTWCWGVVECVQANRLALVNLLVYLIFAMEQKTRRRQYQILVIYISEPAW